MVINLMKLKWNGIFILCLCFLTPLWMSDALSEQSPGESVVAGAGLQFQGTSASSNQNNSKPSLSPDEINLSSPVGSKNSLKSSWPESSSIGKNVSSLERDALVALYNSTAGGSWTNNTNWLSGDPCVDEWFGVSCDPGDTMVTDLSLFDNNLSGILPSELGNLTSLTVLNLSWNSLTGAIPTEIGGLTNLGNLDLSRNTLSGTIPSELGNLSSLFFLQLSDNQLSGNIPSELGNLSNCYMLSLDFNQLTGSIPSELGNLSNLVYVYLHINQLSGSIPPELANLSSLLFFYAQQNSLSGNIPPELGSMNALRNLHLNENNLAGSIPPELGDLSSLRELSLSGNELSGSIPSELGNLNNLYSLYLASNNLIGAVPTQLMNCASMIDDNGIDIRWNGLFTEDTPLSNFLDAKQVGGIWDDTQTVPPTGLNATGGIDNSITLDWTLIPYNSGSGVYEIYSSLNADGPYAYSGQTVDKTESTYLVSGLNYGTYYYFVVQTVTEPHADNDNLIRSLQSVEVSAMTGGIVGSPGPAFNPSPSDLATEVSIHTSLQWDFGMSTESYELYFGTDNPPLSLVAVGSAGQTGSYNPTSLAYNTAYYWQVKSNNTNKIQTVGPVWQFSTQLAGGIPPLQRDALVALYNSTNGASWTSSANWLSGDPCTQDWYGITCKPDDSSVQEINLANNNLSGTLPPELGDLEQLSILNLNWNELSGALPSELSSLQSLYLLDCSSNQLSGSLPSSLGSLTNLQYCYLNSNQFSGEIPPELGNLPNIISLSLYNNQLSGTIPLALCNLSSLMYLYLGDNPLSGTIPTEIGNLQNLRYLYLYSTQIEGAIPSTIGNLTLMRSLLLHNTELSGELPPELGNLSDLRYLYLQDAHLSGTIPSELGNLNKLDRLFLQANQFSGPLPTELQNCTSLDATSGIDFRWNALYSNDAALTTFLDGKQLTGNWESTQTIPPSNLNALTPTDNSVNLDWTPIDYTADIGRYEIMFSEDSGGPYSLFDETTSKLDSSMLVNNLDPGTTYYFIIETVTDSHLDNRNTIRSTSSLEVFETTTGIGSNPGMPTNPFPSDAAIEVSPSITITWDFGVNTDSYDLYFDTVTPPQSKMSFGAAGASGSYSPADLIYNTTYYWQIVAKNSLKAETTTPIWSFTVRDSVQNVQKDALITLYNNTGGLTWTTNTNWLSGDPCDNNWYGITCNAEHTSVTAITLVANNLGGTIPAEIGDFPDLTLLDLSKNQVAGTIPQEISQLGNLESLDLSSNNFNGMIPTATGILSQLQSLDLSNTSLSGALPSEIGNLSNLTIFNASDTLLSGSIPSEFGNMTNLQQLDLAETSLESNIPPELGSLQNLTHLDLSLTSISGTIPPELGSLSNLTHLFLSNTGLTGNLPPELGQLSTLITLELSELALSGSIPTEFGNMTNIEIFQLDGTSISGSLPAELGSLANLRSLLISGTELTGSIPSELGNLSNLEVLNLSDNHMNGAIPSELGNLSGLQELNIQSNMLAGAIPSELQNCTGIFNFSGLDLRWNALYTENASIITFINTKHTSGNWQETQTVIPANFSAHTPQQHSITLDWTAIPYSADSGGYEVFYSTAPGGPYTSYGQTANKTVTSQIVDGLTSNITYYFTIETVTDAHGNNRNSVRSESSVEISENTQPGPPPSLPTNPLPGDSELDVQINTDLSWDFGSNTLTYEIYFDTVNPPLIKADSGSAGASGSYDTGLLDVNTTYYWQIRGQNNEKAITNGAIWSFTTFDLVPLPYTESFEADLFPPVGWVKSDVDGTTGDWRQASNTVHPYGGGVHDGLKLAYFYSYYATVGHSTRLTPPPMDLSGKSNVWLTFWMYHDTTYSGADDHLIIQGEDYTIAKKDSNRPGYQFKPGIDLFAPDNSGLFSEKPVLPDDVSLLMVKKKPRKKPRIVRWSGTNTFHRYDGSTGWKEHAVDLRAYDGVHGVGVSFLGMSESGSDIHIDYITVDAYDAPRAPTNPEPGDAFLDVSPDETISWTNGFFTDVVDVYFGTDLTAVTNMDISALVVDDQLVDQYSPVGMTYNATYYWRVVDRNNTTLSEATGPVWH